MTCAQRQRRARACCDAPFPRVRLRSTACRSARAIMTRAPVLRRHAATRWPRMRARAAPRRGGKVPVR
eukprot:3268651-Pyramimonas_sp.AAC.1